MQKRCVYSLPLLFLLTTQQVHATDEKAPWARGLDSPELGKLLQELNQQYGPDAVALLGSLLNATIYSGSVLTATVRVHGTEMRQDGNFLIFRVETGIIFNSRTHNKTSRLTTLWAKILEKAFAQMTTMKVPADGVMVDLLYYQKSYPETDELHKHVDEPGTIEEAKFYFPVESLRAFLNQELPAPALLARTAVLVDNTPAPLILPGVAVEEAKQVSTRTEK
ncbi:MAG: hypothetical protein ACRERD_19705 [Candidatus Binatia bacterium]